MKKFKKFIVSIIVFIICLGLLMLVEPGKMFGISWNMHITYDNSDEMSIYYNVDSIENNTADDKHIGAIFAENESRNVNISMDEADTYFQIYMGTGNNNIELKDAYIQYLFFKTNIDLSENIDKQNIEILSEDAGYINIKKNEGDSYLTYNMTDAKEELEASVQLFLVIAYIVFSLLVATIVYLLANKIKLTIAWIKDIISNRRLIFELSKSDFKMRYAGSNLGVVWAFVQPVVTVLIYVFVFQYGFKSVTVANVPYVLWLIAGIVPWFFFSEALMNATNSLMEYSYLVKKVVFKINILPMVKIVSAMYVHIFFIGIAILLYFINGVYLRLYAIQIIYYSLCTAVLLLGISYITASVVLFFKDLGQIVNILLQFGMWLTPIMWSVDMLVPKWRIFMKLNPMYYIADGYRDSLYSGVWS